MNTGTIEYIFEQAKREGFKNTTTLEALIRELMMVKSYNESTQNNSETYLKG
jgi:hypothetical protein